MLPTRDGVSPSCVATPAGTWPLMLDFLVERIPAVGRDAWQARMTAGDVLDAKGQPVSPSAPFAAHRKLYYWRALSFEHPIPFEEGIVFQDAHLVVADKPHFLPVTPKGRYVQQTLLVRLKKRLGLDTLVPIHRIDRETAGLVAFSVRPQDRHAYQSLFRDRAVLCTRSTRPSRRSTLKWHFHCATKAACKRASDSWPCTPSKASPMPKP
jgi:tRNA pseudouridine32 synthase/23S rRNA pseudouridine746 synthase